MFLTSADPFLCESSSPSGCREWKFSRDWLMPHCTAPRGRLQLWLCWDKAVRMTLLAREKPVASVRCFVLQPTSFMFWGNTESDGGCGIAPSRGGLWGLSMNLATFKLVSMRQAFLVTVEKTDKLCWYFKHHVSLLGEATDERVAGWVRAACSERFFFQSTFTVSAVPERGIYE